MVAIHGAITPDMLTQRYFLEYRVLVEVTDLPTSPSKALLPSAAGKQVGDFIQIGTQGGTVREIGLKTSRLKTLQGEELVVSNKELTSARIQNFGKLTRRRVVVNLGATYETPTEKLKALPEQLKKTVNSIKDAEIDRVHFKDYGDFSLGFELVYFVDSPDYYKHMDVLQEVNFAIRDHFEKEQIEMAYPTQTLHIQK